MRTQTDPLEKSFQLAYFIVPERSTALDIVAGALEKWKLQCRRERKRVFWRDKHPERTMRRITRRDLDALQWLVMLESETREKEREASGSASLRDMIVHYVKHLVSSTTPLSSFHVTVALNRLVYNYSTSEVQTAYRYLARRDQGADQYRRTKTILMRNARQRFGERVSMVRLRHGEVRFSPFENQARWVSLTNHCLDLFTPWSTDGLCTYLVAPRREGIINIEGKPHRFFIETAFDEAEINRCHIFIEPSCSRRLLEFLGLDAPESRLALPSFLGDHKDGGDDSNGSGASISELSREERRGVARRLKMAETRRRELAAKCLRVVSDGAEVTQLNCRRKGAQQLVLANGVKLIEIWAEDESGDLLVSTLPVTYSRGIPQASQRTLYLNNGKVDLSIAPEGSSSTLPRIAVKLVFEQPSRLALTDWIRFVRMRIDDWSEHAQVEEGLSLLM